jgi:hypothetical protein
VGRVCFMQCLFAETLAVKPSRTSALAGEASGTRGCHGADTEHKRVMAPARTAALS